MQRRRGAGAEAQVRRLHNQASNYCRHKKRVALTLRLFKPNSNPVLGVLPAFNSR